MTATRLNPLAAARDVAQRFEDSSALNAAAGALQTAYVALAIQLKDMHDDAGVMLVEEMLYRLEDVAAKMRVRASDIGDGL